MRFIQKLKYICTDVCQEKQKIDSLDDFVALSFVRPSLFVLTKEDCQLGNLKKL